MTLNFRHIKKYSWLFVICLSLLAIGCQKVINIDLNSVAPAIVITGNIDDQQGPYTVTLSQTVNFSEPNTFPPIDGAFITIADNAGTVDTLVEISPGTYRTKKIMGVPGRTYYLTVIAGGQTYTASSTMPQVVPFDSLGIYTIVNPFRKNKDTSLYPQVGFHDPAAYTNYYRFIETRNDTLLSNIYVVDDQYFNGRFINYPLRSFGADTSLVAGDSVKVEMQCIDQGTYQYLSIFYEASGESNNLTPANPTSNISNNALGYFSAHTSRYKSLKVP